MIFKWLKNKTPALAVLQSTFDNLQLTCDICGLLCDMLSAYIFCMQKSNIEVESKDDVDEKTDSQPISQSNKVYFTTGMYFF